MKIPHISRAFKIVFFRRLAIILGGISFFLLFFTVIADIFIESATQSATLSLLFLSGMLSVVGVFGFMTMIYYTFSLEERIKELEEGKKDVLG